MPSRSGAVSIMVLVRVVTRILGSIQGGDGVGGEQEGGFNVQLEERQEEWAAQPGKGKGHAGLWKITQRVLEIC